MILIIGNPKESIKKLSVIELINSFCKEARLKTNIQKSVAFLYPKDEASEKEIKLSHSQWYQVLDKNKIRINLSEEVEDLYNKNCLRLD